MADEIKVNELDEAAGGESGYIRYVVEWGDTLSQIALDYGTTVAALCKINNIPNPDVIKVGQVLCIPARGRDIYL